jgi:hypothetical protein
MAFSRGEALSVAQRLRRTMDSAPDPRRQAQMIYSELVHTESWSDSEQRLILTFGSWLADRPPLQTLRSATKDLLRKLEGKGSAEQSPPS